MSVLRTGVYANDTTPLWQSDVADAGGSVVQMITPTASIQKILTNIANGVRVKAFNIDIPPAFKGKACLINASVFVFSVGVASGTTCSLLGELNVSTTTNAGTSSAEQTYQVATIPIVSSRTLGFSFSMVVVPPGNGNDGIYFTNQTGVNITTASFQVSSYSIQAIDNTATDNNSLIGAI